VSQFVVSSVTLPQSAKVSDVYTLKTGTLAGLWVPVITSTQNIFFQCAADTTSANFVRFHNAPPNSGDYTVSVAGQGSFAVSLADVTLGFGFLRIETLTSEVATRVFLISAKL